MKIEYSIVLDGGERIWLTKEELVELYQKLKKVVKGDLTTITIPIRITDPAPKLKEDEPSCLDCDERPPTTVDGHFLCRAIDGPRHDDNDICEYFNKG